MEKITKTQAIANLKRGNTITVYRNKVNPINPLGLGVATVTQKDLETFQNIEKEFRQDDDWRLNFRFNHLLSSFEYYNSDEELGNKTCYAI